MKVLRCRAQNLMGLCLDGQAATAQQVEAGGLALLELLFGLWSGRLVAEGRRIDQAQQPLGPSRYLTGAAVLRANIHGGAAG